MTWVCLKMGYTPNEIAIFRRDNDQQNHWVFRATLFSDKPIYLRRNQQGEIKGELTRQMDLLMGISWGYYEYIYI